MYIYATGASDYPDSFPSTTMKILQVTADRTGNNLSFSVMTSRSLLVVNRGIKIGFHYDSLNQRNEEAAKETLGRISILLNEGRQSHLSHLPKIANLPKDFSYIRQPCPQQLNVSDCGVHVLYNTRVLIQRLMYPAYRPERPWDLSDIRPDTPQNRAALRMLFQQKLLERLSSTERESVS